MRDVFECLLQAASVAEKVRLTLNKRPKFTVRQALSVLSQRGSSDLAITKLHEVCETHQLVSADFADPLSTDMASLSVQESSHRQGGKSDVGSFRTRIQLQKFSDRQHHHVGSTTEEKLVTSPIYQSAGVQQAEEVKLLEKRNSGSYNDEAFESERKRTGKFKVEHLQDCISSQFD